MSEPLVIDGVISAGEAQARVESGSRTAFGLNLPMAGAVLLHLVALGLVLTVPGLGGEKKQLPDVYPIRLYSVAEVAAAAPGEPSDPVTPPLRRASALVPAFQPPSPVLEMAPVEAWPGGGEMVPPTATPVAVAPTVALAQAQPAGNGGLSSAGNWPAFPAEAADSMEVAEPVATGPAPPVTVAPPALLEVLAHPLYRENPEPEYPALARRRQQEGTVVLEALVTLEGKVGGLAVRQSSGHPLLDEAAVKGVKGWRFEPGRRGAAAVAMKVLVPVRFGLR